MGDLSLEVGGQVDDVDGVEGTLLRTDTTSNAQPLRYKGNLAVRVDFNAQLASSHDGTGLLALLPALLRFTLVRIDNGDTEELC